MNVEHYHNRILLADPGDVTGVGTILNEAAQDDDITMIDIAHLNETYDELYYAHLATNGKH